MMHDSFFLFSGQCILALLLAPLLPGIINRVKAKVAGRRGKPLFQLYYDLGKLLRKDEVISTSSTWIFNLGPAIALGATLCALFLLPVGGAASPFRFEGDFMAAAYLLGLGRFCLILGAQDTASPFEGMGASREATYAALAEPVLFLCFLCLMGCATSIHLPATLSLSTLFGGMTTGAWTAGRPELVLIPLVIFLLLLVENCRIPVDDPNTHLELTMIHEAMILDHSGPNLAYILYGAALKLWIFAALLAGLLVPALDNPLLESALHVLVILLTAVLVGIVESVMARLPMIRIPSLLGGAGALAALAMILTLIH